MLFVCKSVQGDAIPDMNLDPWQFESWTDRAVAAKNMEQHTTRPAMVLSEERDSSELWRCVRDSLVCNSTQVFHALRAPMDSANGTSASESV